MKNKLAYLTDHLFAQLERLGDENLDAEQLKREVERAKAMAGVSSEILAAGRLAVDAAALAHKAKLDNLDVPMPPLLEAKRRL